LLNIVPQVVVQLVKQWHIDAVIMGHNRSTEAACGGGPLETKRALQEAGIPVMMYETSMCDPRYYDEAKAVEQVTTFFESLEMKIIEQEAS
jgi:benzoyl-CoA reductase/2-hydroxyglutaryl-CoA dehydratase subunit BcrC/BadD/HgdB